MRYDAPYWIAMAVLAGLVALCLFGISRIKSRTLHERGHLALSFIPWAHLVASYAVALYVRLGFGAWPRSCIDNPDLPMLYALLMGIVLGLLGILLSIPVWLGWFIIRMRRRMNRYWILSTALFLTGIVLIFMAQLVDPWKFWEWVWD